VRAISQIFLVRAFGSPFLLRGVAVSRPTSQVDGGLLFVIPVEGVYRRRVTGTDHDLTDNEGTLLALLARAQPLNAYQIGRIYEDSPVSNFNTSKGKLYPLIRRLKACGYIESEETKAGSRKVELLRCTSAGEQAVRAWVMRMREQHLLLEDPLRTKVQSFDLLSRDEQIEWLVDARAMLAAKLEGVEEYGREVDVPYQEIVHDNAVSSLRARLDWLDRTLRAIVKS
jgi:DNA-binding PadR family transcriptional regulator